MKKFVYKLLAFIVLVFVGSCFIDFAISKGLSSMNDYRFTSWREIDEGEINADILISGNSRALSHFVPSLIDSAFNCKTYNLGFGGHTFTPQYFKYGFYVKHNKKPKLIIQNVDFGTLSDMFIIGHEREQVFPYIYDSYMRRHLVGFGFTKSDVYLPLKRYFGYQQVIKNGLFEFFGIKHYNNKMSFQGFVPENGKWNPSELNQLKSVEFSKDSTSVHLFKKYLNNLKNENIELILVNSPVYYKATEKLTQREEMHEFFNNVASENGFVYLDYTDDSICFDSTRFVVSVHLNEEGAKIFTRKLVSDLRKNAIFEKCKNK